MNINEVTGEIIRGAMRIHSALGPGLLESAYQACLAFELRNRGLHVVTQARLPVMYNGVRVDVGYRIDLLVDGLVIVELKTVAKLLPIHQAQILSYLKLSNLRIDLLINFHVVHLKDGIRRIAN